MRSDQRVNVCFHGIGVPRRQLEPGEDRYWISTELFERILDYATSTSRLQLSFDDGNASDIEVALPALRSRGLRAVFFPIADRIGRPGSVDRVGLRALVEHGMSVGSHGMRHVSWRRLDDAGLDDELVKARRTIATESGAPVTLAACPLGSYDRRVLTTLRRLGYARVFTSDRNHACSSAWLQPRYSVLNTDSIAHVRAIAEAPRPIRTRLLSAARTTVKRWR